MNYFAFFALLALTCSNVKAASLDEDFGYVDVRTGAHMFWVVYHTELPGDWTEHPLIMWLQGGPGASGVGYGNFKELGPYDINGNLRPGRWTQKANVMFVDNPVGTGYSYVDAAQYYTTDNKQIADDLVTLLKSVFTDYPDMQVMPFFVYCESYGGKMTADFAVALDQAIANGEITANFKGIAMGDSWISPMDSVNTWGPFLYQMGFVNADGQAAIDQAAAATQTAVNNEQWSQATTEWGLTENVVLRQTDGVDFYNVLSEDSSIYDFVATSTDHREYSYIKPEIRDLYFRHVIRMSKEARDELGDFMNGDQATHWNIPDGVVWDSQGGQVFNHLQEDFMKPVVDSVAYLLTNSNIHVTVYSGDLDLICDTPGTYRWIENMDYPQKPDFESTARKSLTISAYPSNAAYVQRSGRFSVFTILRSGHMVPIDAPEMTLSMIDIISQYADEGAESKSKSEKIMNKVDKVHAKLEEAKKDMEQKEAVIEKVEEKGSEIVNHPEEAKEKIEEKKEQLQEAAQQKHKEEVKEAILTKVEEVNEKVEQKKENDKKASELKDKVVELVQTKKEEEVKEAEAKSELKEKVKNKVNAKHPKVNHKKQEDPDFEKNLKLMLNNPLFQNPKSSQEHPNSVHH